ncbi:iron chelate uptake ABC transporter family permease subunit, partial [Pseudomonas aeruginosa]|uniref:iron chelate uptake ABC transporter family permease subunit n=1 Tax=Pseudomonas aeruginosa TaxID=287 RepID=UPI002B400EEA
RVATALLLLAALLAVAMLVAAVVGPYRIAPLDVVSALFGRGPEAAATVLWRIRLPRILADALAGAALAAAGAAYQG